jgi:fructosamine-3-kinase
VQSLTMTRRAAVRCQERKPRSLASANAGERRLYRRDPRVARKEQRLLSRLWQTMRVPKALASGEDFLVLEHMTLSPPEGTAEYGHAIGAALAEIHAQSFVGAGLLGPDLEIEQAFGSFASSMLAYLEARVRAADTAARALLMRQVLTQVSSIEADLTAVTSNSVLLHGDFKATNLHRSPGGVPIVLDWEFAYSGPPLMDVGQLIRWEPPAAFQDGFAASYRECGGRLPEAWPRWAPVLDLINLVGLLEGAAPGSLRERMLARRIQRVLELRLTQGVGAIPEPGVASV